MAEKVLSPLQHELTLKQKPSLILSILAGTSTEKLEQCFNLAASKAKLIRAMPNTPALVGEGAIGVVFPSHLTINEREIITKLLQSCSKTVIVLDDENLLHAVTAVSGSGPAYVFLLFVIFFPQVHEKLTDKWIGGGGVGGCVK